MTKQQTVALFTRYPVPGASKTRLIPALGPEGAASLQRRMTETAVATVRGCAGWQLQICYTDATLTEMQSWLGPDLEYRRQADGDLGQRMAAVLIALHRQGRPVCLIGSDCPDLTTVILEEAFSALERNDFVLGPSHDGGYYLVGCRPACDQTLLPRLFEDITWGRDDVLARTLDRIRTFGATAHLLPRLHDIDTPEDLRYLGHHPDAQ